MTGFELLTLWSSNYQAKTLLTCVAFLLLPIVHLMQKVHPTYRTQELALCKVIDGCLIFKEITKIKYKNYKKGLLDEVIYLFSPKIEYLKQGWPNHCSGAYTYLPSLFSAPF